MPKLQHTPARPNSLLSLLASQLSAGHRPFLLLCAGLIAWAFWSGIEVVREWPATLSHTITDLDEDGVPDVTMLDTAFALYIRALLSLGVCLMPAMCAWFMRYRVRQALPLLPVTLVSGWLGLVAVSNALYHGLPQALTGNTGDEPYAFGFAIAVGLTAILFAIPPVALWLYAGASVLDRYVTRAFLTPFGICFTAFVSIWLISDLANNGGDFSNGNMDAVDIATLYAIQLPAVVVLISPITLLLALLYALGNMSRRNELISMMMAGRSLPRILRPIFVIGILATLVSLVCNYQWAPSATGTASAAIEAASKKKKKRFSAYDQSFINRAQNRIWFVGRYPQNYSPDNKLESVVVVQFNDQNLLQRTIHADKAYWQRNDGTWVFSGCQVTDFDAKGEPIRAHSFPKNFPVKKWNETPWRIVSAGIKPEFLGLPQIGAYLRAYHDAPSAKLAPFRTHWQHRLALPFACLAVCLFGAPLGIVYSRRGLVGSATAAVLLFFGSLFLTNLLVALGQSSRLPAVVAAWLSPVLFCLIGLFLLWLRGHNRELPSFFKAR